MSSSEFFEGDAFIDGGTVKSADVTQCAITDSSVDMNMRKITNLNDPVNPYDAANKKFVDALSIGFTNVNLIGTTPAQISPIRVGGVRVHVTSTMENAPYSVFEIFKNSPNQKSRINVWSPIPGIGTGERLSLTWAENSGIFLQKSGNGYDGIYLVKTF